MSRLPTYGILVLLPALVCAVTASGQETESTAPLYGFTAFPYDDTAEATERTNSIILEHSNLYAIHFDNCIPWHELLDGGPLPEWMRRDWAQIKNRIPETHVTYVAVTPSSTDRKTLAPACGSAEGEERALPDELTRASFDHPDVIRAYSDYADRVVEFFEPRYLTIAIEISELSLNSPDDWPKFETLFMDVYDALKAKHPDLQIGSEYILQSLRAERVARQVKRVVEKGDYLGLSFYPYGSDYGVLFGAPPLPTGEDQWRVPLAWVREYTDKPIAICETGYTTEDISLPQWSLRLEGDVETQRAFARDLVAIAKRDRYEFVVWFLAIDYDKLYQKMPPGSEVNLLWRNIGLFDGNLNPKPALSEWDRFSEASSVAAEEERISVPTISKPAPPRPSPSRASEPPPLRAFHFNQPGDLFTCTPGDVVGVDENGPEEGVKSMRWSFEYKRDFMWCLKKFKPNRTNDARAIELWAKSDRDGAVMVRLDEREGESFFAIVPIGPEWQKISIQLEEMFLDDDTKKNGQLDPGEIAAVMIADGAGLDGVKGERVIWLSEIAFR